jgi:hypothetical protein
MTTDTSTQAPAAAPEKYCFSGSGKRANRKWAPGGDASYLSRLRKAHLAKQTLPDPWHIQLNGGVEANAPDEGWPQLNPMEIAQRLDEERGPGAPPHWVHTLERAEASYTDKAAKRAARDRTTAERKAERERERQAQENRPKEGETGEYNGQPATVLRRLDPERILIQVEEGAEELIYDEQFVRPERESDPDPTVAPVNEGEFVEQQ